MHKIFSLDGFLNFSHGKLASVEEYKSEPRDVGTIFEALEEGDKVVLQEGIFVLDKDLDLVEKIYHKS